MEDELHTQIWDMISENDCFTIRSGLYIFNVSEHEYQLTKTFKFSEFCKVSHNFVQKFTILWEYITRPQNINNITIIQPEISDICKKFYNLQLTEVLDSGLLESTLYPMIRKNKDRIVAAYMLLRYLSNTIHNHCFVCGSIISWDREVCNREICIVVNYNRPNTFTSDLTEYQKLIKLVITSASSVYLSPKIVEFTEIDNRITLLYYHILMYNFVNCNDHIEPGYKCLKNASPSSLPENTETGYHGSPLGKWASILRSGLINLSNTEYMSTGAVYGKGVYFSKTISVAKGYAGGGIIAVCNFPKPEICDPYYVVPDHNNIYIKYLIFPEGLIV